MKNRPTFSSFLFIMGIFSSGIAFSQDDRLPDLDLSLKENRQESSTDLVFEGESKIIKPVQVTRDSVQVRSTASKKTDKGKPDENSVLKFNFLYYLIERFKLADIVD